MFMILLAIAAALVILWVVGLTTLHFGVLAWAILVVAAIVFAWAVAGRRRGSFSRRRR